MSALMSCVWLSCRSPHGERGLKYGHFNGFVPGDCVAPPPRGAWIEIVEREDDSKVCASLPTRGAWIEMSSLWASGAAPVVAPPHGERGLKSYSFCGRIQTDGSLPTQGAWIKVKKSYRYTPIARCSPYRSVLCLTKGSENMNEVNFTEALLRAILELIEKCDTLEELRASVNKIMGN